MALGSCGSAGSRKVDKFALWPKTTRRDAARFGESTANSSMRAHRHPAVDASLSAGRSGATGAASTCLLHCCFRRHVPLPCRTASAATHTRHHRRPAFTCSASVEALGDAPAEAAAQLLSTSPSLSTAASAASDAASAAASASQYVPPPLAVEDWQLWVGFLAGLAPVAIATFEFGKRIAIQRQCAVCAGSGRVTKTINKQPRLVKCVACGGFLPWVSWKLFLQDTQRVGNGGALRLPRGQKQLLYDVDAAVAASRDMAAKAKAVGPRDGETGADGGEEEPQ